MKFELEHSDVCRAIATFLRTRNVAVEPEPGNFQMIVDEAGELTVVVRNADFLSVAPAAPVIASPAVPMPAVSSAPATPPKVIVKKASKNDPYQPVAPPQRYPRAPKQRILDAEAATSHGMRTSAGDIVPSEVVHEYRQPMQKEAVEAVEEPVPTHVAGTLSEEDQAAIDDILSRSREREKEGPVHTSDDAGTAPEEVGGVDDLGQGEFLE